jgi:hypothetical protein
MQEHLTLEEAALLPQRSDEVPHYLKLGLLSGPVKVREDVYRVPPTGSMHQNLQCLELVMEAGERARRNSLYGIQRGAGQPVGSLLPYSAAPESPTHWNTSARDRPTRRPHSAAPRASRLASLAQPRRVASGVRPSPARPPSVFSGGSVWEDGVRASTVRLQSAMSGSNAVIRPQSAPGTRPQSAASASMQSSTTPLGNPTASIHALERQLRRGVQQRYTAAHIAPPPTRLAAQDVAALEHRRIASGPLGKRAMLPTTLAAWDASLRHDAALRRVLGVAQPPARRCAVYSAPSVYEMRQFIRRTQQAFLAVDPKQPFAHCDPLATGLSRARNPKPHPTPPAGPGAAPSAAVSPAVGQAQRGSEDRRCGLHRAPLA